MKNLFLIIVILSIISSCSFKTIPNNKAFIKDSIETHTIGEFSSSTHQKLCYVAGNTQQSTISNLEVTGYETQDKKGIILGLSYITNITTSNNTIFYTYKTEHINLTPNDVKLILDNYQTLIKKSNTLNKLNMVKQPSSGATQYIDFTISSKMYISISHHWGETKVDFWINGKNISFIKSYATQLIEKMGKYTQTNN